MARLAYALPFVLFIPGMYAMYAGGLWAWFLPVFTFVAIPLAEQAFEGSTVNADGPEEAERLADPFYDYLVWMIVPAQYALLGFFLWRLSLGGFDTTWENVGLVASMGIGCGVYGINVAHELGHRATRHEQWMARALLLTSLYTHFLVEHNRGHHRRVSTPEDPASARRGESVYAFWVRSVTGGLRSAWELEAERLGRKGQSPWSLGNEVLMGWIVQVLFVAAIGLVLGPLAMVGFVAAATIGFLMLETVNYIEHYGLTRQKTERGGWERVRPIHSWNTNRPLGRLFLFELTRHSDHHANAVRKYQVLRHFDEAPQLPSGYPGMMVLSMVPPLYFAVMEGLLARYAEQVPQAVAAK